jgi:hypothetical protein
MTPKEFCQLALSFPEAIESAHMDHPDFRVAGKIFATLGHPNENSAMVKLSPDDQKEFVGSKPDVFERANGAWGQRGSTIVHLPAATIDIMREALTAAWRNAAPKRLSRNR